MTAISEVLAFLVIDTVGLIIHDHDRDLMRWCGAEERPFLSERRYDFQTILQWFED
jgi:hypothetical protein